MISRPRRVLLGAVVLATTLVPFGATQLASAHVNVRASQPDDVYRVQIRTEGKGTVKSAPAGISCPSRCITTVPRHAHVAFTALPAKGWKLARWYGACTAHKGPMCAIVAGDGTTIVGVAFRAAKTR